MRKRPRRHRGGSARRRTLLGSPRQVPRGDCARTPLLSAVSAGYRTGVADDIGERSNRRYATHGRGSGSAVVDISDSYPAGFQRRHVDDHDASVGRPRKPRPDPGVAVLFAARKWILNEVHQKLVNVPLVPEASTALPKCEGLFESVSIEPPGASYGHAGSLATPLRLSHGHGHPPGGCFPGSRAPWPSRLDRQGGGAAFPRQRRVRYPSGLVPASRRAPLASVGTSNERSTGSYACRFAFSPCPHHFTR